VLFVAYWAKFIWFEVSILTTKQTSLVWLRNSYAKEARTAYRLGAKRYFAKSFGSQDLFENIKDIISSIANSA
jgi:hypothetical protein